LSLKHYYKWHCCSVLGIVFCFKPDIVTTQILVGGELQKSWFLPSGKVGGKLEDQKKSGKNHRVRENQR